MSLFLPFLVGALVGLTAGLAGAALERRRRRAEVEKIAAERASA